MLNSRRGEIWAVLAGLALCMGVTKLLTAQTDRQTGAPLAPWKPGVLDIYQISTGRGNSTFFIFPDGTTLLVDAGAAADGIPQTEVHPNASREPGGWIAEFVKRHLPFHGSGLDYAL